MPEIQDPEYEASYSYQARRNSLIRISHHCLPPLNIPVELLFPRWWLSFRPVAIAWLCSLALIEAAKNSPATRKRTLVIPISPGGEARLRMKRVNLSDVTRFLSGPPPAGYNTHEDALIAYFSVFLLNPKVLARIACPARGPRAKDQRLYDLLPGTLLACCKLVVKARDDEKLERRVREVIEDDGPTAQYVRCYTDQSNQSHSAKAKNAIAVALAARALRTRWLAKSDRLLLLQDSPETVLKNWLYPKKKSAGAIRLLELVHQRAPDFYPWDAWTRLYLGEPGDAARAFGLIPV